MKKITFLLIILISTTVVMGQLDQTKIDQFKWDDPLTFKFNPPLINGYGEYSDSLAKIYDGYEFYECNDEYYAVSTLSDYYYWFVKEYWWKFNEPEIYEYYYFSGNNLEMMKYIYGDKYTGKYYPINIAVEIEGMNEYKNEKIKDDRFFADNEAKLIEFKADLNTGKRTKVESNSAEVTKTNPFPNVHAIKRDKTMNEKVKSGTPSKTQRHTKSVKPIKR